MRFLIDTNIFIPVEPLALSGIERGTSRAATFVRLAGEGGHRVLLHPLSTEDIARDRDTTRREIRLVLMDKYGKLERPPPISTVEPDLGPVLPDSNDWVDHHLIAAVVANAVDYLVSDDGGIHRKAARLSVSERVLTIEDAVEMLEALQEVTPVPPPSVEKRPLYLVDSTDPIFDSLRSDYPEFDDWLARASRAGREAWVVLGPDSSYAAVAIFKSDDDEFRLGGKVLKLSTMKVSAEFQGSRYGELLLKTLFEHLHQNSYDHVWVTVFEKHAGLISLLEQFGFYRIEERTPRNELVYAKSLRPSVNELEGSSVLERHIRFGPPYAALQEGGVALVPILPRYHRMLFPEYEAAPPLFSTDPFGNALRKAYLCNSRATGLTPGMNLLFYRSDDDRSATVLAVVEAAIRSTDVDEILRFVGQRTVYSRSAIELLARSPVLAVLFRQDRLIQPPISDDELVANGVMQRAPQSIMYVRDREAITWLRTRVGQPS